MCPKSARSRCALSGGCADSTTTAPTSSATTAAPAPAPAPATSVATPAPPSTADPRVATTPGPEVVAADAVVSGLAALGQPSGAWDRSAFTADSPTAADIDDVRRRLAADGSQMATDDVAVVGVEVDQAGETRTATVEITDAGTDIVNPNGDVTWSEAGEQRFSVDLVWRDGRWQVVTIAALPA